MRINPNIIRSMKNGTTYPTTGVPKPPKIAKKVKGKGTIADVVASIPFSPPAPVPAKAEKSVGRETADDNSGATTSIGSTQYMRPVLEGIMSSETVDGDGRSSSRTGSSEAYRLYRDMYMHDPICGAVVDLMSTLPFSDFSLLGIKEKKARVKFEESIANCHIKSFLPGLSVDFLVNGLFCGTTLFDEQEKVYAGIVPQNIDYIDIVPVPVYGQDPIINLRVGDALKYLDSEKTDDRLVKMLKDFPDVKEMLESDDNNHYRPDPENILYVPRQGMLRNHRGISIYRRIISTWILEKLLVRGSLEQLTRRQRAIVHISVGEDDWIPDAGTLNEIASLYMSAALDPIGAVFATRTGVNISEVQDGAGGVKHFDNVDYFNAIKMKAMGVNESFLSGDASFSNMENILSVFMEQMRAYRSMVTKEIFSERMFPKISKANNFTTKRHGIVGVETASTTEEGVDPEARRARGLYGGGGYMLETSNSYTNSSRDKDLLAPIVHWMKQLKPEADAQYLDILALLKEQGMPIPMRMWAMAGGMNLNEILDDVDEDLDIRERFSEYMKKVADLKPKEDGEGGGFGGEFASMQTPRTPRKNLPARLRQMREDGTVGPVQLDSRGRPRHLTSKMKRNIEEASNKKMARAAARLAQKENHLTKKRMHWPLK